MTVYIMIYEIIQVTKGGSLAIEGGNYWSSFLFNI